MSCEIKLTGCLVVALSWPRSLQMAGDRQEACMRSTAPPLPRSWSAL